MTDRLRIQWPGRWSVAILALLTMLPGVLAAQPGTAPTGDPGGFGIDGDLDAGTPVAGTTDWMSLILPNGIPSAPATFHGVDQFNDSDFAFFGDSRLFGNPNTAWFWDGDAMTNPIGGKENFSNGLAHFSHDANGHTWFTWSVDRQGTGGDSYMEVALHQNTLVRNINGTFSSAGPHAGHTVGDLMFSLSWAPATSLPVLTVWRWSEISPGAYDITSMTPAPGTFFTGSNGNIALVPYTAFGQGHYPPGQFAEASIDLTALLGGSLPPTTYRTLLFSSRFGDQIRSVLKDFIEPIQIQFTVDVDTTPRTRATRIVSITPNPSRGAVSVEFELAQAGPVSLEFFDLAGRRVGAVNGARLPAGRHAMRWDPTNGTGRDGSGVLFARLTSAAGTDMRRLILMP